MSKRLKKVFTGLRHTHLLETVQPESCFPNAQIDVFVEEHGVDGRMAHEAVTRHIKVCHSQNICVHYEIPIDPATGIGHITISDIEAVQHVIVQTDERGFQMIRGDAYDVTYLVNDEVQQEDYATVYFTIDEEDRRQSVRIINTALPPTSLIVEKWLRDEDGNEQRPSGDMRFAFTLQGENGYGQKAVLSAENAFCVTLDHLRGRNFQIVEGKAPATRVSYRLNNETERFDGKLCLSDGENVLQLISERLRDTSLKIEKFMRDEDGHLCKPAHLEEYEVRVIGDFEDHIVVLDEDNNYCQILRGLHPGFYDVRESSEESNEDVRYIVNGNREEFFANVEVNECEEASVIVINGGNDEHLCDTLTSPLRICKFIRTCDGRIAKPQNKEQFMVMVSGCGMCETFNLNASNNYCVDIANLCDGVYSVEEVSCHEDYATSYIVNEGMEKTSACVNITSSSRNSVAIINEERNRGALTVCKYIRNEYGDLVKPRKDQCFTLTLSSYFCKRCFELNAENDWCVSFCDLRFGSYEVREEGCLDYDVTYSINAQKETRHARFVVDGCCEQEIRVINAMTSITCGVLRIAKFMETASGELVKPSRDEEFEIEVRGEAFCERYLLRPNNNWCIFLEGLLPGEYHIAECDAQMYRVSYLVNGEENEEAIVMMGEASQEVAIVNQRGQQGMLKLRSVVRDCDGSLQRPPRSASFDMLIEGKDCQDSVTLCAENNWCIALDGLAAGSYHIIQKDNLGYRISYCIDGCEESFAHVVLANEDIEVLIINEESDCSGTLTVTKYIEDEDGRLLMPALSNSYRFTLRGCGLERTYKLTPRNDFCVYFDDLPQGRYEICEQEDASCDVRYCINGETLTQAVFQLEQEDLFVDIINRPKQQGMVTIEKRIREGERLVMPQPTESFKILLKGKHVHEIYELNAQNEFCITLSNLANQHYEIRELGTTCHCYEINGELQDNGYFLYDGTSVHMTIINESVKTGCMKLDAWCVDACQEMSIPPLTACFEVVVESDAFKQKVVLNQENDFCVRLYDLPQGHYEVCASDELGGISYLVNDLPCARAIVDVADSDVCVRVLQHEEVKGCIRVQALVEEDGVRCRPKEEEIFTLEVVSSQKKQTLCLDATNDFTQELCDLASDSYTLSTPQTPSWFLIEQECFENVVCIELNGQYVDVILLRKSETCGKVTICKRMLESWGGQKEPDAEEVFVMELVHKAGKESFTLNKDNQWTKCFDDLAAGAYEVRELGEGNEGYQIDGGTIQEHGYFELQKGDREIRVLNPLPQKGIVHLEASVQTCDGREGSLKEEDVLHVRLCGEHLDTTYVLHAQNGWHQKVEVLPGSYTITQTILPNFAEVKYLIDGQQEKNGTFSIAGDGEKHIELLQVMECHTGSIDLRKYVRDASCSCLKQPQEEEEFEVEVRGTNYYKIFTLNSCNHFREHIDQLAYGTYEIREISEDEVSYIVNGDMEDKTARICVQEGRNDVKIINERKQENVGSIEICKLMQEEDGSYGYPDEDASFWVSVIGEQHTSRVLLNDANRFYASVRHLNEGYYEVREEGQERNVSYVINNGPAQSKGMVQVKGNANTVNIINPRKPKEGCVRLEKYVEKEGLLVKPERGEYRIHVSRPGFNEIYVLNADNAFRKEIRLPKGTYVIDELDHDEVSYIIDGGSQVDGAVVNVCDAHVVKIINHIAAGGSITMAKYIRENERLMRPQSGSSYIFQVAGEGYHQLVTLDESNHWMATLQGLRAGTYRIQETTNSDEVSFIINAQEEQSEGIVAVCANSNTVQIINTRTSSQGKLILQKSFREENGQLITPPQDFRTRVHVSKPGYNEIFLLDQSNHWSQCIALEDGLYVVDEVDEQYAVSYIVNGGSEVNCAIVNMQQNTNTVQIINAPKTTYGSIHIQKFIRQENGELKKPSADFTARVQVSKPGYREVFTLHQANDWQITLRDLMDGTYVINEVDSSDAVTYIINGGSEVNCAVVSVERNENHVQMIDRITTPRSSLTISKHMRNAQHQLVAPAPDQSFQVVVEGEAYQQRLRLQQSNNWTITLSDLPLGSYQVREESMQGYQVSYIVDDQSESAEARVTLNQKAHSVNIINSAAATMGKLEITKFIKQASGALIRPADGDRYVVEIYSMTLLRRVELNFGNNFTMVVNDLPNGTYGIRETANEQFITTYRVNGGAETDSAMITMSDDSSHIVEVINELRINQNTIEVFKYMLDKDDNYLPPSAPDIYHFRIHGQGIDRTYELNVDNDWHQTLTSLPSGEYRVEEIGSPFAVQYLINSPQLMEEAVFTAAAGMTSIIGIINRLPGVEQGEMTLRKWKKRGDGALQRPQDGEAFTILVKAEDFLREVTLDKDNDFTQRLENLPFATYTIQEQSGSYTTLYRIDNGAITSTGTLTLQDQSQHQVDIINAQRPGLPQAQKEANQWVQTGEESRAAMTNTVNSTDSTIRIVIE